MLFCVSVNNSLNEEDDNESLVSYNELRRMITALGGRLSPTVHKNVSFLIASDTAVANATQRVRKAFKYGVPVLRKEYIELCYSGAVASEDTASFQFAGIETAIKRYEVHSSEKNSARDGCGACKKRRAEGPPPLSYMDNLKRDQVFECSCICHDRGEDGCSYCFAAHSTSEQSDVAAGERQTSEKQKRRKRKKDCSVVDG